MRTETERGTGRDACRSRFRIVGQAMRACAMLARTTREETVGVIAWIRSLFSSVDPEDEAAEREEFGIKDRGEAGIERERESPFETAESADLARSEIDALEEPSDLAP